METHTVRSRCMVTVWCVLVLVQVTSCRVDAAPDCERVMAVSIPFSVGTLDQHASDVTEESKKPEFVKPGDRAAAVSTLASYLGLGEGSVIADIGAGIRGQGASEKCQDVRFSRNRRIVGPF